MQRPLSLADTTAFFVPLIFWAQMMMLTHSVIHAWLARGAFPTVALAGFSIALSINGLLASAFLAFHPITLGFVTGKRSVGRILILGGMIAMGSTATVLLIALTPLGEAVYGLALGAGPSVTREAQAASLIFAWIFPFQLIRNVGAGLLMLHRRTVLIAAGTLLRLLSLGGFLVGLSLALHGAPLGAGALVLCVAVEAAFVIACSLPIFRNLPPDKGPPPDLREIWRYGWPLILNAMMENALVVIINGFLGRLSDSDQALAAFGVARGLLMVMMSPLRNLAQTAQALTHTGEDLRVVRRFAVWVVAAFTVIIAVVFNTPLRDALLATVMGLSGDLRAAVSPGLMVFVFLPALWSAAALNRGLLAGARRTGMLAVTGAVRLAAAALVAGGSLAWPDLNGALIGILALGAAFGAEGILLAVSLRRLVSGGVAYPPAPATAAPAGETG